MKFIPVGQIVAFQGLRGEVRFRYYNESSQAFPEYRAFFVDHEGKRIKLKPSRVGLQGGIFVIKFRGFDTREKVHFLLRKELLVAEEDLPPLEQGEYYDFQLVGLEALTTEGHVVGHVKDVMHTGASDILVIAGDHEVLVPMTENHIDDISLSGGFVRITEAAIAE